MTLWAMCERCVSCPLVSAVLSASREMLNQLFLKRSSALLILSSTEREWRKQFDLSPRAPPLSDLSSPVWPGAAAGAPAASSDARSPVWSPTPPPRTRPRSSPPPLRSPARPCSASRWRFLGGFPPSTCCRVGPECRSRRCSSSSSKTSSLCLCSFDFTHNNFARLRAADGFSSGLRCSSK